MDRKKYYSTVMNATYKANLWMLISIFLIVSNLMLVYSLMTVDRTQKIIVTPPMIENSFSIQGNQVSEEYIIVMAKYFAQLFLTYHQDNALSQFETILHYIDPKIYKDIKELLYFDYEKIVNNDMRSVFYLSQIHINNNVAIIDGELNIYMGKQLISSNIKTYKINFDYRGKLLITGFNQVVRVGNDLIELEEEDDELFIEK